MQGVEILTSVQVATEFTFNWTAFWITFVVVFGICLISGIWYAVTGQCEWVVIPIFSIVGIITGLIGGFGLGNAAIIPIAYETQYRVTISDEVLLTEFYEHYEVIDQDGKIFTVREKTNE